LYSVLLSFNSNTVACYTQPFTVSFAVTTAWLKSGLGEGLLAKNARSREAALVALL